MPPIEPIAWVVGFGAPIASAYGLYRLVATQLMRKRFDPLKREYGLVENGNFLFGVIGELTIAVELSLRYVIRIEIGAGLPRGMRLDPPGDEGHRTGDWSFDAQFAAFGPEIEVIARLSSRVRNQLRAGIAQIEGDYLVVRPHVETPRPNPEVAVRNAVETAEALTLANMTVLAALEKNAASDPEASVRARNLDLLISRFPDNEHTMRAARLALRETDDRTKVAGAIHLGETDTVERIIRRGSPEARARALSYLARTADEKRARELIDASLGDPMIVVRHAAIHELARLASAEDVDRLAELGLNVSSETQSVVAIALGVVGHRSAEPHLIRMLNRARDVPVELHVLRSLGRVGGRRTVLVLRERPDRDARVRRLKQSTISKIQRRLENAPLGGALSIADDGRAGELSIGPDPHGALSDPQ